MKRIIYCLPFFVLGHLLCIASIASDQPNEPPITMESAPTFERVFFGKLSSSVTVPRLFGPVEGLDVRAMKALGESKLYVIRKSEINIIKGGPIGDDYIFANRDFPAPHISLPKFGYQEGRRYLVAEGHIDDLTTAQQKELAYLMKSRFRSINSNHTVSIIDLDETLEESSIRSNFSSVERNSLNVSPGSINAWFEKEVVNKVSKGEFSTHDAVRYFSEPTSLKVFEKTSGGLNVPSVEAVFHLQRVIVDLNEWVTPSLNDWIDEQDKPHIIYYPIVKIISQGDKVLSADIIIEEL